MLHILFKNPLAHLQYSSDFFLHLILCGRCCYLYITYIIFGKSPVPIGRTSLNYANCLYMLSWFLIALKKMF